VLPSAEPDMEEKIKEVENHLKISATILNGIDNLRQIFAAKEEWANAGQIDAAKLIVNRLHQFMQQDREILIRWKHAGGEDGQD
jgi:hypothetical protein